MSNCAFVEYTCTNPHCKKKTVIYWTPTECLTEGMCFYCGAKAEYSGEFEAYDF